MTTGSVDVHLAEDVAASSAGRMPPYDEAAEQGVLGAIMLSKDAIGDVVARIHCGDFYRPAHSAVYSAVLELYGRGEPADAVTVAAELGRRGELQRAGGAPYLHTLIASVPTAASAGYYADIVADTALRRRIIEAGTWITQVGYEASGSAAEAADAAQGKLFSVTADRVSDDYEAIESLMQPTLDELDAIASGIADRGILTGFTDLDQILHGLQPGQLITVAARPGVGKSTIALDFVRHCAIEHGKAAAVFSLEMSKSEITMRILSAEAAVRLDAMRAGTMSDDDWTRLARRMGEISEAPLFIDDSPNLTLMEIRAKARRLKQQHDLKLVVIDYLQLMTSGKKVESRQQEVSEFSRSLKLLAKELEVPVIAISQLNRGPEQRPDKRPQVSDLRESGSIEQDCDVVLLLHRPDASNTDDPRAGEADVIIGKHRGGPTGQVTLAQRLHLSRFDNLARR